MEDVHTLRNIRNEYLVLAVVVFASMTDANLTIAVAYLSESEGEIMPKAKRTDRFVVGFDGDNWIWGKGVNRQDRTIRTMTTEETKERFDYFDRQDVGAVIYRLVPVKVKKPRAK
ncbi:MAG: hypothetical protein PHF37_05755 [Phycisphaerae bacterium]|nr:hypothetical protein [Phycisphaerae bacterium]